MFRQKISCSGLSPGKFCNTVIGEAHGCVSRCILIVHNAQAVTPKDLRSKNSLWSSASCTTGSAGRWCCTQQYASEYWSHKKKLESPPTGKHNPKMLSIEPPRTISNVLPSTFLARSSSVDLAPPRLYTSDEIGMYDVLCGRDKAAFNNIGNRRFRVTVSLSLERYLQAATRKDKSVVIKSVVTMLHADGGKFLQLVSTNGKNDAPLYIELNEKQAHEKAGHALRDMALLRSKTASAPTSKKNKAIDQPLIDSAMTTVTAATSIASSLATSNKKIERNKQEYESTIRQEDDHLLPHQLDAWTELTWDESSELTDDESIFDSLVQSVVVNNSSLPLIPQNESIPTGMMIMHDSMNDQLSTFDVPFNAHGVTAVNNVRMDVDRKSTTVSVMMNNNNSATHDTERTSSTSFTLDDEMVSWLVGESDFVLHI